jgi:DNA-binding IclR family transcriptional regulator
MEHFSMTIPVRSAHLLTVLKDPLRLRILLALEQRPRSSAELARELELPYDKVNWAMKALARGRLAQLERAEPAPNGQTIQKVYGPRHQGWETLVPALERIAETADDD